MKWVTTETSHSALERPIHGIVRPDDIPDLVEFGQLIRVSKTTERSKLDWAIIELTSPLPQFFTTIRHPVLLPKLDLSTMTTGIEVMTSLGAGITCKGALSSSSTYLRMAHSQTFQEVWTVKLNKNLGLFDSDDMQRNHADRG